MLDAARRLGVDLDTVCGGRGICGRCQVSAPTGTFAKWGITNDGHALSAPGALEHDYHGSRPLVAGQRLGCAARIVGDVVIDVPAASQVHRQVVRKDLDLPALVVDPLVTAPTSSSLPRCSEPTSRASPTNWPRPWPSSTAWR